MISHESVKPYRNCLRIAGLFFMALSLHLQARESEPFSFEVEQLTSGDKHHFFGYIGHCRTIPWNASGRYILGMEMDVIDRMPKPEEAAIIFIVDTHNNNEIIRLDKTHAWNPQQGTMFYWNPLAAETQFFFNDRDVDTGEVYTVIYDIEKRRRVREYRFDDTPIGNGGVAADGSAFLALNYGRLARLRLVTGYPEALDWSKDAIAPKNDGIFVVDIESGSKRLLVSYRKLQRAMEKRIPNLKHIGLYVNHSLWNRDSDRVYFYVRCYQRSAGEKVNKNDVPFSINIDGTGLRAHQHIGGHPEWAEGSLIIGQEKLEGQGDKQVIYDVDAGKIVGQLGDSEKFPSPGADVALSPDGNWFVNGYEPSDNRTKHIYAVLRRSDGAFARSMGVEKGSYRGDIRIDPAPRWNRTSDALLVPGIAENGTRQMFVMRIFEND